ncbi:MAG: phosphotransferase family protein [Proteobacteria bacterium]|nr:phosphotransferase family protein [Pseudomonadota bacterium]
MDAAGDVPGIRREAVARFFSEHVPGGDVPLRFERIPGGRSNLTYVVRAADGGREWVLRRPPLGHVLPTAHDMVREYTVLAALANTEVPAPRSIALCEDTSVNDAPFYVMTYTPGVVLHESLPPGYAEKEEDRRRMSLALVDTLVALHAVDYEAVGLGEFGHPAGFLERQVRRWSQQWERSKTRELPAIEAVIEKLRGAIPESPAPTIVHGDYRLGNIALDPDDPGRLVAIFDWEMATLGDPLTDLGYTLIFWGELNDRGARDGIEQRQALTAAPGFLTRSELIAEYGRRSGRDVSTMDFYRALAHYKLSVISEGIHARYLQGKTVGEGFDTAGRQAEELAERALLFAERL